MNRTVAFSMVTVFYSSELFKKCDFIGPVGQFETHMISGKPQKKQDYTTLFRPYTDYVWVFLIGSTVAVSVALIVINKMYADFTKKPTEESAYQSRLQMNEHNLYFLKCRQIFQPSSLPLELF